MDNAHKVPLRSQRQLTLAQLVSRLRSRSLTELTRQITPPTKNGHAPPPIESRKRGSGGGKGGYNHSILLLN